MNQLVILMLMFVSGNTFYSGINSVLSQDLEPQEERRPGGYGSEVQPDQLRQLMVTPQRIQEAVEHAAKEQQEHWLEQQRQHKGVQRAAHAKTAVTTRYWDCCKPSCSWPGKAWVTKPVKTCNKNDQIHSNENQPSGCLRGGDAFTCSDQIPWNVSGMVSYGFAAAKLNGQTERDWCCNCYELTFKHPKLVGKKMIVQATNTGYDLTDNHFDIGIPGSGQGIFEGCKAQYGRWYNETNRYGGISDWRLCYKLPQKLRMPCLWRFNWFKNADNPMVSFRVVPCPKALTAISGCVRK